MLKTDEMVPLDDTMRRTIPYQAATPDQIWANLTSEDLEDIEHLCRAMKKLVFKFPYGLATNPIALYMYHTHYRRAFPYIDESNWFAEHGNGVVSKAQTAMLQHMYTWAHIVGTGCSTCCIWDEATQAMVCMRSLDWDGARALGRATRIYDFQDSTGAHSFTATGAVGMAGMLTAVKQGFSMVINYLPWPTASLRPKKTDPLIMLRQVLEDPDVATYEQAVAAIEKWQVGAPVCLTICGVNKNEACVIEIGKDGSQYKREAKHGLLIQTNHYDHTSPFSSKSATAYNYPAKNGGKPTLDWHDAGLMENSRRRRCDLGKVFGAFLRDGGDIRKCAIDAYQESPVWNYETAQWAFMRPASGEMEVWARYPKKESR